MKERKLDLKNPWAAGALALLIPGGGHLYQGRYFKGVLYLICILGTFLYGMQLGEWRPVYWTENPGGAQFGRPAKKNLGFLAQIGMGSPAVVAYLQSRRYHGAGNLPVVIDYRGFDAGLLTRFGITKVDPAAGDNRNDDVAVRFSPLEKPLEAEFQGTLQKQPLPEGEEARRSVAARTKVGTLSGTISLEPLNNQFKGRFQGTLTVEGREPEQVEYDLGGSLLLDSPILGDPRRKLFVRAVGGNVNRSEEFLLVGSIRRGFFDWFEAPLDESVLQDLNRRLNKQFEMALVYTWIAGLLNILAVWDAVQGPAYGFGDEPPPDSKTDESADKKSAEKPPKKEKSAEKHPPAEAAVDAPATKSGGG